MNDVDPNGEASIKEIWETYKSYWNSGLDCIGEVIGKELSDMGVYTTESRYYDDGQALQQCFFIGFLGSASSVGGGLWTFTEIMIAAESTSGLAIALKMSAGYTAMIAGTFCASYNITSFIMAEYNYNKNGTYAMNDIYITIHGKTIKIGHYISE